MPLRRLPLNVLLTATVGLCGPAAWGLIQDGAPTSAEQQAKGFVDDLYAQRISAVQRTRDSEDDLALMAEMLDIAPTLPSDPVDAQAALYVRITEMTDRSRAGYDIAIKALDALAKYKPGHPSANAPARLELYAAWYRSVDREGRAAVAENYFDELVAAADAALGRGDHVSAKRWYSEAGSVLRVTKIERAFDLRAKLVQVRAIEQIEKDIKQLQDAAAREALRPAQAKRLVVLLAAELDRMDEAGTYAVFVDDKDFVKGLRSAIALGGRDLVTVVSSDHPPGHWFQAGNWYAQLADEPGLSERATKQAMELAMIALNRYIDTTTQDDIDKARAVILLRQLDERYTKAFGPEVDESDLLKMLDPTKHTIGGAPFTVRDNKLILPPRSILHLPTEGGDHYKLTLAVEGDGSKLDALVVWVPVAGRSVRVFVDGGAHRQAMVEGLQRVAGSEKTMRLDPGNPAKVSIEVQTFKGGEAAIRLAFNGTKTWQWRGKASKLTDPPYGKPPEIKHFSVMGAAGLTIDSIKLETYDQN